MSQKRTQIRSLTMVNFRGIFFKTLDMHPLMSNLIGHNGAGKTTIMGALLINRVPDNRLIRLRNNSDSGKDSSDNGIWGRIGAGTCYSLVDYELHDGSRAITVVRLRRLTQPKVELKLYAITGIDADIAVRDVVMKPLPGEQNRYEPLDGKALKNQVTMLNGELHRFDTTAQYMSWQFEQRIIPRRMENSQDRQRYYRMLETSLYGGLSAELQKGLRDYLLPADNKVRESISSMQNALQETQRTRHQIAKTRNDRKVIRDILESSYALGEHVLAWSDKQQQTLQAELKEKQQQERLAQQQLETYRQQLLAIDARLLTLESQKEELSSQQDDADERVDQSKDLERLHTDLGRLSNEQSNHLQQREEETGKKVLLDCQYEEQAAELERLNDDISQLVDQLTSAEKAYSEEARKAGLYLAAIRALTDVQESFDQVEVTADKLGPLMGELLNNLGTTSEQYYRQLPLLEQAEKIRSHFDATLSLLASLGDNDVTMSQAAARTDFWRQHHQQQTTLALQITTLVKQQQQRQQEKMQLKKVQQALAALPDNWQQVVKDEASWNEQLHHANHEQQQTFENIERLKDQAQQTVRQQDQVQSTLDQARKDHIHWFDARKLSQEILANRSDTALNNHNDFVALRQQISQEQQENLEASVQLAKELETLRVRMAQLEIKASRELQQLQKLAEMTGGVVISDYFDNDDISLEEAAWLEAKFGPLRHAIQVRDIAKAANIIREENDRPDHVWLLSGEPGQSFADEDYLNAPIGQKEDGNVLVEMTSNMARLSREPEFPTIGRLAREKEQARLREQEEQLLDTLQEQAINKRQLEKLQQRLDQLSAKSQWLGTQEPPVEECTAQLDALAEQAESLALSLTSSQQQYKVVNDVVRCLEQWQSNAWLLNDDPKRESLEAIAEQLQLANDAKAWLSSHEQTIHQLNDHRLYIDQPPVENLDALRAELDALKKQISQYNRQKDLLNTAIEQSPNLRFAGSVTRQEEKENLQNQLQEEFEAKKQSQKRQSQDVEQLRKQCNALDLNINTINTRIEQNQHQQSEFNRQIADIPLTYTPGLKEECEAQLARIKSDKNALYQELNQHKETQITTKSEREKLEERLSDTIADIHNLEPKAQLATSNYQEILKLAEQSGQQQRLNTHHLLNQEDDFLRGGLADARAALIKVLESENSGLLEQLEKTSSTHLPGLFQCFIDAQNHLAQRIDKTLYQSDDPRKNLELLEERLTRLETLLKDAEQRFLAESDSLGQNIQRKINKERKQIHQLNAALSSVHFGTIRAIKIELEVIDSFQKILDALQQEFYADLFRKPDMTVEAALEYLFKKETGGTIVGDKLLDYREYIRLNILIQRAGSQHYEPANPTNLSTGEAIGTGLAILTMVLHSWEVATDNRDGKGHAASRLLFLDEAARLDAKALATLEELCLHQSLQLMVGAPDNVLPKNGVTYRMVRLMEPYEHVIFSGVKGRLPQASES
ncbi:chromosome partition protein MukB [uncultured Endozoicomonas sp.]|uniref:chromosome partition protein MukB n=1 Tax=uncultured Endozoicomonas sp. TaxID=432652 RepID=UPI00262DF695|nr:chromosome partition protein MukB [uncultured Endozoicomonas sp.]